MIFEHPPNSGHGLVCRDVVPFLASTGGRAEHLKTLVQYRLKVPLSGKTCDQRHEKVVTLLEVATSLLYVAGPANLDRGGTALLHHVQIFVCSRARPLQHVRFTGNMRTESFPFIGRHDRGWPALVQRNSFVLCHDAILGQTLQE